MYHVFDSNDNVASVHTNYESAINWISLMAHIGKTGYYVKFVE